MMIKASTVEAHRFGMVRKKGYDPVEVDAVMERLVAALETHERVNAELQGRVSEADDSVEAVRRTYQAAQQTKRQMVTEGQEEADELVREARAEVDEMSKSARTKAGDILAAASTDAERDRSESAAVLVESSRMAEERLAQAEADADAVRARVEGLTAGAQIRSERVLEEATDQARTIRIGATAEAEGMIERSRSDAEERTGAAEMLAAELVADARRRSEEIINAVRREEAHLRGHLARLSIAVSDVEDRVEAMARTAKDRTASIAEAIEVAADGATTPGGSVVPLDAGSSDASTPVAAVPESSEEEEPKPPLDDSQGHSATPVQWLLDQTGSGRS